MDANGDHKITIFDLSTGDQMFECNEDLNFPKQGEFLLEKNRILQINDGKIYSAIFWTNV